MKRMLALAATAALATSSLAVLAQTRPNFAGKWTLVPDPNAAAAAGRGRGVGGLGSTFIATQDDKVLTVVSTTQMGEIKAVYNLDGSETKNPITLAGQTVERTSKTKWDGAKLIVMSTVNFQGNAAETTQVWSLDASGTLTVEQTSNFGGSPTTTKAQYKKSQGESSISGATATSTHRPRATSTSVPHRARRGAAT
jgi:hypothetical protein